MIRITCIYIKPYLPELVTSIYTYIGVDLKYLKKRFMFFRSIDCSINDLNKHIEYNSLDKEQIEFNNNGVNKQYYNVEISKKNLIFIPKNLNKL